MLILIGGGSCAGKSTFAAELNDAWIHRGKNSQVLSTDLFYKDLEGGETPEQHNFDSETSIDQELLYQICAEYPSGISSFPVFQFRAHKRNHSMELPPLQVLILEGIFALSFPAIVNMSTLTIFIDTPEKERYKRRFRFYSEKLGHSKELIDGKFFRQAEPYYKEHIEPWQDKADIRLSGEKEFKESISEIIQLFR